jgi:hypothetical protein
MRAQHGSVHRVAIETFGGVKLKRIVDAQYIDRADLRHHVGGNQHYDLVQSFLGRDLLRHGFAKPSQQDAGASRRASHCFQILSHQASLPGGRELALNSKRNNFIHSAVLRARDIRYRPNHIAETVAQFTIGLIFWPYTESIFALPSKTPAT